MEIPAYTSFNKIYIIESLKTDELQTGDKLYKDRVLIDAKTHDFQCQYFKVTSKTEFVDCLKYIYAECEMSEIYPLISFDVHGSTDQRGLVILPSKEIIVWSEFIDLLSPINITTKNNLTVLLSVCFGFMSILDASILEPVPFYLLIGPETSVNAGYIYDKIPSFFQKLILYNDVNVAFEIIKDKYKIFHSELVFLKGFKQYCEVECNEKRLLERAVEVLKKSSNFNDHMDLNKIHDMKEYLKPNVGEFDKIRDRFLHISEVNRERFQYLTYDMFLKNIKKSI